MGFWGSFLKDLGRKKRKRKLRFEVFKPWKDKNLSTLIDEFYCDLFDFYLWVLRKSRRKGLHEFIHSNEAVLSERLALVDSSRRLWLRLGSSMDLY